MPMSSLAQKRTELAYAALVLAIIVALKSFYREASAADLNWILMPTAKLVSLLGSHTFVFEPGAGWVSQEALFAIAPECAGVHFMLAAFLSMAIVVLLRFRDAAAVAMGLALSLVLAYAATLVVNATRILIALHAKNAGSSFASGADLHRVQGIAVFVVGLFAMHALAERAFQRHA